MSEFESRCAVIRIRTDNLIERHAEAAHREIHAMCESARRSLGQLTRKDYLAKRFVPAPPPAPQWVQLWVDHFFNLSKPRWPR